MELKITKEKILEAASKCSTAKEILKTLFPEVFENNKYFDLDRLETSELKNIGIFSEKSSIEAGFKDNSFLEIRNCGYYRNKGFYLSSKYDWTLIKDSNSELCLIPTKKYW